MMSGQSFLKRDDTIGAVILAEASTWIGTPYRHQGSRKGVGCDCLGLVRGVWRAVYGSEPESPSAYGADWWVRGDDERLLEAAMRHCRRRWGPCGRCRARRLAAVPLARSCRPSMPPLSVARTGSSTPTKAGVIASPLVLNGGARHCRRFPLSRKVRIETRWQRDSLAVGRRRRLRRAVRAGRRSRWPSAPARWLARRSTTADQRHPQRCAGAAQRARIPGADEGAPIPRVHGTVRIAGTLIWATRFEETRSTSRTGGKASQPKVETLAYFGNFAIGLCEGEIAGLRRVWADGREIDLTEIEMRVYRGTRDQWPDPLIEAKQGAGNAPAYRGLAYVVFERLPLDRFRQPDPAVLQFEVIRVRSVKLEPAMRGRDADPRLDRAWLCRSGHGRDANSRPKEPSGASTATCLQHQPTGAARSTNCRRCAPICRAWRWSRPGSAMICARPLPDQARRRDAVAARREQSHGRWAG